MAHDPGFKARVYSSARKIPRGKVASYAAIARAAGNPRAARAVGTLMHHNDYPHSGVPCHRIIKSDGSIGGYAGGPAKKRELLISEGISVQGNKIDLSKYAHTFL